MLNDIMLTIFAVYFFLCLKIVLSRLPISTSIHHSYTI